MTTPLFDVKANLSEYVVMAEKGDVIEITKHGKTTAVIISQKEYKELKQNYRPSFIEKLKEWKDSTGGLTQEEYDEFAASIARNKETYTVKKDLF
ncbi:MAG: type II toxin-antitoxin system prevent-host-death family antitoxin [Treponema sp.]|nr:type II toxin-antitoxin system prevent-host-death family antitoxin [Treponema sp.]